MKLMDPKDFPNMGEADFIQIQKALTAEPDPGPCPALEDIRTVAGVDLAYWKVGEAEAAVCCVVVLDVETWTVLEEAWWADWVGVPYIPGCFAFRELPLVLPAAARLTWRPDLFLFDGNGLLHPRGMGLATHAAFYLDAPTAGVAKRYFQVEGAAYEPPEDRAGAWGDIRKGDRVLGRALRTHRDVKPVYLSVGRRMDLEVLTALALGLTDRESHIPLPTRLADLATHRRREELRLSFPEGNSGPCDGKNLWYNTEME